MMIDNEKGFTFPFTFIILLLFSFFLAYFTEQYILEKKIFTTSEKILMQEYYMVFAVKEVERSLQHAEPIVTGTFEYTNGSVSYFIEDISEEIMHVTFQGELATAEQWSGIGFYDKREQKMIKWKERR